MKRILCLVDFSEVSKQGMEYASHLAKALQANLSLLYVRTTIWPEAIQLEHEEKKSNESILGWLSIFAREIHQEFGIFCEYHLQETTSTVEEVVAEQAERYDLVVMGTNGVDNFYQYAFGSNSFHVMQKSKCPVLIVPAGYMYRPITQLVYAYDPDTNPLFLISQLKKLATQLGASVKVLHIPEEEKYSDTKRKMEILEGVIKARESGNIEWSFDFEFSNDVPLALDEYMKTNTGDILALSFHHRSLVEKLFKENVIKKISMIADYPVFTFWH